MLFTYLHIAADEPLTRALVDSGDRRASRTRRSRPTTGALPLLAPMSEVAGRLAAQAGAYFLEKPLGGRGLLLGGVPGVAPGKVVVHRRRHRRLQRGRDRARPRRAGDDPRALDRPDAPPRGGPRRPRQRSLMSSSLQIEESVADADVVIGAVLIPGALAPKLVTREMVGGDEGGLGRRATSRSTRAAAPRRRGRRRTASPSTSSTASRTTASRTCPAPCRSRRRRR